MKWKKPLHWKKPLLNANKMLSMMTSPYLSFIQTPKLCWWLVKEVSIHKIRNTLFMKRQFADISVTTYVSWWVLAQQLQNQCKVTVVDTRICWSTEESSCEKQECLLMLTNIYHHQQMSHNDSLEFLVESLTQQLFVWEIDRYDSSRAFFFYRQNNALFWICIV